MTALKTYIVSAILAIVFSSQDTLWATPNHPFWYEGYYVEAAALHEGDTIETLAGDYSRIQQIIPFSGQRRVYNITVAENRNYYVGNRGMLVHNDCFLKRLTDSPELMARINALSDALKGQFIQDFYEAGEDVIKVLKERPGCMRAWDGLVNRPEWVRKNVDLLERIASKGDDYITRVNNLYSPSVMKLPPNLKPPNSPPGIYNGIEYDIFGFPKLEPFVSNNSHVVKILMDGTNDDYIKAYNELKKVVGEGNIQFTNNYGSSFRLKQNGEWSDQIYTWHHHQDGETMMPVLQEMHQRIQNYHTGGRSIVNNNLVGLFDPPQL